MRQSGDIFQADGVATWSNYIVDTGNEYSKKRSIYVVKRRPRKIVRKFNCLIRRKGSVSFKLFKRLERKHLSELIRREKLLDDLLHHTEFVGIDLVTIQMEIQRLLGDQLSPAILCKNSRDDFDSHESNHETSGYMDTLLTGVSESGGFDSSAKYVEPLVFKSLDTAKILIGFLTGFILVLLVQKKFMSYIST